MIKRLCDFKLIENKRITEDLFILELSADEKLDELKPGQFAQVRIEGSRETFLRRPISIHDVDIEKNTLKLLIQKVGSGTSRLAELLPGDTVNMLYPLGNTFSDPQPGERILLIGGGVGVAPLLFLGKHLRSKGYPVDWLLGFRNRERLVDLDEYRATGNVYITTEDGSEGEKGFVTGHSVLSRQNYDMVYCCGPDPMMKAVAGHCRERNINCEVSLENLMACGFGICLCCIVETVRGNICTCTEGPVFNIRDLKW